MCIDVMCSGRRLNLKNKMTREVEKKMEELEVYETESATDFKTIK